MARQLRLKLQSERLASLDEFARGASNAQAAMAVESWPDWIGGCLAIVGPQGAGKSHLARAWAAATGAHVADGSPGDISGIGNRPVLIEDVDQGVAQETTKRIQPGVEICAEGNESLLDILLWI
jgi:ABC-type dipeptide/oligopeptide/nickel transport system ATPase subunit